MMSGANPATPVADDFSEVFERDHDRGADVVAPDAGQPRDDAGRFAPKPEGAPEPQATPQIEATPEPQASPQQVDPDANRHVPLRELKGERTKRQEAEARAKEYETKLRAYEDLLLRQSQQSQPAQHAPQEQMPDPYTDPDGYLRAIMAETEHRQRTHIANLSEANARRTHGDKLIDEATQWAGQTGQAAQFFYKSADPYHDVVQSYRRYQALQQIGPDPDAYRAKVRQEVLAELKAGGNQPPPRFPGSLASATGSGSQGAHLSMEAVAAELFDTNRNRKSW